LRENDKTVIGVGVKNATSDLLTANCDEFIFYDDLVRKQPPRGRAAKSKGAHKAAAKASRKASRPKDGREEAFDLVVETYEALVAERGESEKIWGSMIKQTLKRRRPGFSESYFGFRSFGQLLEEAEADGVLELERDERSGGFIITGRHGT